jgi:hypothetical protein
MKYLKMFESFDFFHRIDPDDYTDKDLVSIDKRLVKVIEDRLKHTSTVKLTNRSPKGSFSPTRSSEGGFFHVDKIFIETTIIHLEGSPDDSVKPLLKRVYTYIGELPDEWFVVSTRWNYDGQGSWQVDERPKPLTFYKCDQIEGLMELLKKLHQIK